MLVVGEQPELKRSCNDYTSIRFILSNEDGILSGVEGLDQAQSIAGIAEVKIYSPFGTQMRRNGDFRDRVGHVIARGATQEQAVRAAEAAHRAISLITEPHKG
jgi:biotin carboxylase